MKRDHAALANEPSLDASGPPAAGELIHWHPGIECCNEAWEAAFQAFETPQEEIAKFVRRLRSFKVDELPKDVRVVELFCGRGSGLLALEQLGFKHLEGVDLSASLAGAYRGPARLYVGDCRELKFADNSKDLIVIQGGLHHLPELPGDLEAVLGECRRVLHADGRIVIVEPWLTPFLSFVHFVSTWRLTRALSKKLDAFATMVENEQATYDAWLSQPDRILDVLNRSFVAEVRRTQFGKLHFSGHPR